jgi:hypothetical protein
VDRTVVKGGAFPRDSAKNELLGLFSLGKQVLRNLTIWHGLRAAERSLILASANVGLTRGV